MERFGVAWHLAVSAAIVAALGLVYQVYRDNAVILQTLDVLLENSKRGDYASAQNRDPGAERAGTTGAGKREWDG